MIITIPESGMQFGPFDEVDIFRIEKSQLYKSLGENIKAVEFVLCQQMNTIYFIEAKSSSPRPHNNEDFNKYILELHEKFAHSIDLFFPIILKRKEDIDGEMPRCFHEAEYARIAIKLILVINGHETGWLTPISDALKKRLKRQIRTWNLTVTVLNHQLAYENQLISELP
ncbi:MAG: hypothetical protein A4E52_01440 [Pelotomaculum sp. PtaB.Bin013]|nr:MAG: hypothetical protein A4E52_01440 [Pelotomaculum sp. PtaB.Bin013]